MTTVSKEAITAARQAYWNEIHNGNGYGDEKPYEAAISAALPHLKTVDAERHERAIEAAINAANKAAPKAWHSGENMTVAVVEAAISAYLASLGAGGLTNALEMTGCENEEDLIDMANVGNSLMNAIDSVVNCDGPFKHWSPADDPAEIVGDLYNALEDALGAGTVGQEPVTDAMVETAAEAYWLEVYGRHRKSQKWPDDVHGRSEELFRSGCRAALEAVFASPPPAVAQEPHPLASFPGGLKPGLYLIHWKSGGTSQAAIGMMSNGTRWIAPTNWIRPGTMPSAGEWGEIERAEPIAVADEVRGAIRPSHPFSQARRTGMSIREWIAEKLCPQAFADRHSYRRMKAEAADAYHWLGGYPDAADALRWLLDNDCNRNRALGVPALGVLPSHIDGFREMLERRRAGRSSLAEERKP